MRLIALSLCFVFVLCIYTACKKDVGSVSFGDYPVGIGSILVNTCAVKGCHDATSSAAAGGLNLESWQKLFSGSNSGSPVIPFSSKFSSLCYAINTYPDLGISTEPTMPLNQNPLSHDQVKKIEDWINEGAPDIKGNVMWSDPGRKKLYAVNQGCDVVTVFDSESQLPIRYIEVGRPGVPDTPHQIRVSPDGKYWYVIFINHNVMEKYSCSDDKKVGEIPMTPLAAGTGTDNALNWNTFNISSDSKRAYSVSWQSTGRVSALDLANMRLIHYIALVNNPHAIAINANETKIYVGAQTGNYITEIDTAFSNANEISLDGLPINFNSSLDPHDMVRTSSNELMITCQKSDEVRVLRLSDYSVTAVIPLGTGSYPQEIVYSSAVNKYYVSCYDYVTGSTGKVVKIDPGTYSITNLKCGYQPHGIGVDEKKKLLYVLSRNINAGVAPHHSSQCAGNNGFVNFIDLNTFTVQSKKFEMSVDPYFIAARP